jgi:hypothetical protein
VSYGQKLYIEYDDAKDIVEKEKITLMKWGNCTIEKIVKHGDNKLELTGRVDEEDQDFKKTKKLTWLCADPATTVELNLVEYAHLINKQKIEENDKVEDLVNRDSKFVTQAYAEGSVRSIQKQDIIQFERRGYYICDKLGLTNNLASYFFIPDGKAKAVSKITNKVDAGEQQKGTGNVATNKKDKKPVAAEGEEVKLSKKEASKLAKAEAKQAAKEKKREGGAAQPEEKKEVPNKGKQAPKQAAAPA